MTWSDLARFLMNWFKLMYQDRLRSAKRYVDIILFHTYSYLKADATRGYLGALWWILEPIMYMAAFYIVFSIGLRKSEPDYIPFLLIGLTSWKWFATNIQQGSNSIKTNIPIMRQVYVPKYIFLYSVVLTNTIKYLVVLSILIIFIIIYGIEIKITWIALPILIFSQFIFIAGASGILSAVVPLIPDLKLLIENVLLFGLFISGIFFNIDAVSYPLKTFLKLNPMALYIINYRKIMLHGEWPIWNEILILSFLSILFIFLSLMIFRKYDRYYLKIAV